MARKQQRSLLRMQQEKLKAQKAAKAAKQAKTAGTTPTKVGRTKRLNGRIVKWNGKRWAPTTQSAPTPKSTPKPTPKPNTNP